MDTATKITYTLKMYRWHEKVGLVEEKFEDLDELGDRLAFLKEQNKTAEQGFIATISNGEPWSRQTEFNIRNMYSIRDILLQVSAPLDEYVSPLTLKGK